MNQWYAVNTHARDENRALFNLRRQGFTTYLPKYSKRRSHARRIEWLRSPLFPCYLFVNMDITSTAWHCIESTFGVRGLVRSGSAPTPVPRGIVERIMDCEDDDGLVILRDTPEFNPGDEVRIIRGGLFDRIGRFACATDLERVVVLLDILGREVKVTLSNDSICAYG